MWLYNLWHDSLVADWILKIGVLLKVKGTGMREAFSTEQYVGDDCKDTELFSWMQFYFQVLAEISLYLCKKKFIFENIIKDFSIWYGFVPKCVLVLPMHLDKRICQEYKQTRILKQLILLVHRGMKFINCPTTHSLCLENSWLFLVNINMHSGLA